MVSTPIISSRFHAFTGQTFKSYLNLLKLDHAKKLLLSGDMTVTAVGYSAGFASLPNFLRCFKAHFGVSPGQMLKQHRREAED